MNIWCVVDEIEELTDLQRNNYAINPLGAAKKNAVYQENWKSLSKCRRETGKVFLITARIRRR